MTPEIQLDRALDEWERLATAEGEAISARDWTALATSQNAIQDLQPQVTLHLAQLRATPTDEHAIVETRFCARASRLLEIARQNAAMLQEAYRTAQSQLSHSRQTARALRTIRASCSPVEPAGWTSFS